MNRALKVVSIVLSIISLVSLISSIHNIAFRVQRSDWVITDAEITFIGLPDAAVEGNFTDFNGVFHSEQFLYLDWKFQKWGLYKPQFPSIADPDKYIGKTVRIMYDPEAANSGDFSGRIDIASYDNWLKDFIISVSVFGVSTIFLVVVRVVKIYRKTASDFDKKA